MIEKGALSDNILPSSSKEVQEKEDDLTLKGIPSRHNQPLTTSDIREKENMHYQSQSIREISKEAIHSKHNLSFAIKNPGTGNPLNNDWGNISNFRTNSPWNKVSAKDKGNPSEINWKPFLYDEDTFKGGIQQKQNPAFVTKKQGIGNPSKNGWGNVSKIQTNSTWNRLSAKDKGNTSKVIWQPLRHDEDNTTPNQSTRGYPLTQRFDTQPRYETQDT